MLAAMTRPTLTNTLRRAAAAFSATDYELARDAAATAVAIAPDSVPAHHYLAASLAALGQVRAADRAFHEGLSLAPADGEILLGLCDLLTGELATEAAALEEALGLAITGRKVAEEREDPSLELEFILAQVRSLISLGRSEEALTELSRVEHSRVERHCDFFLQRGIAHFESGALTAAHQDFDSALEIENEEPLAFWYQGLIAELQGELKQAQQLLERARRLDDETFPVPVMMSESTFNKALDRAASGLEASIRVRLSNVEVELCSLPPLALLGQVSPLASFYAKRGVAGQADRIMIFRRNLERQSRNAEALNRKLSLALRQGLARLKLHRSDAPLIPLFAKA